MFNLKRKKRAFTLAETLIVASLFAVMVLWIIFWINRAFAFMNNTRVLVRATNFAREGVEMVYNLRDTNRRRCSGIRDQTRLYRWWTWECSDIKNNDDLLIPWVYTIKEVKNSSSDDSYIKAEYLTWDNSFYDDMGVFFKSDTKNLSKIDFSWTYEYNSGGTIATWNLEDLLWWSWIEFYRVLRVFGVYCKNDTDPNQVADFSHCKNDTDPKELRFCVKVFYTYNGWYHASELCSIMTNFME